MRDKLIELIKEADSIAVQGIKEGKLHTDGQSWAVFGDHLIANGVTVQGRCHKAESVISKTGLMCTACHSDIDRDAVFCKYCGAKVMPQPPKGE